MNFDSQNYFNILLNYLKAVAAIIAAVYEENQSLELKKSSFFQAKTKSFRMKGVSKCLNQSLS